VIAQAVNRVVSLRHGRNDEPESDRLGFRFMTEVTYNPKLGGLLNLMQAGAAKSGGEPRSSSAPTPALMIGSQRLQALISETYPNGVFNNPESGREDFY